MPIRLLSCCYLGAPIERQTGPLTRAGLLLFFAGIIRRSAVLAAAVVLGTTAGRAETAALPVTEIASGVFVHNGVHEEASAANEDAIANIGFMIGDEAVAVIDPGGSFAEGSALRAAIRARTDQPIRYVILTHVHPDHISGAAAFRDDHPDFVGHAKLDPLPGPGFSCFSPVLSGGRPLSWPLSCSGRPRVMRRPPRCR